MSEQQQISKIEMEIKEVLGFESLESKIYLTLLRTNPVTASTLAKNLDLDRAGVYRAVEKMIQKKVISCTMSTPRLLIPIEPSKVIRSALKKKEGEIRKLRQSGKEIVEKITENISRDKKTTIPILKLIQGRENIYTEISQMIENCKAVTYIVTNVEDLSHMGKTAIPEKIQFCKNNGGRICLLVKGEMAEIVKEIKNINPTETRLCNISSEGRIAVCKDIKMIMSNSSKTLGNPMMENSVSTNSIDMINNIENLCTRLWKISKPIVIEN